MINPRETFRNSPFSKGWQDLVDSNQFHMAAQAALAQMQTINSNYKSPEDAAAHAYAMQGAVAFLHILMDLTTPAPKPVERFTKDLNYKA